MSEIDPDRLAGRTAAGSGIGRATALRLAREGPHVVAPDISEQRLEPLLERIPGLPLVPVAGEGVIVDVSSGAGSRASASGVAHAASTVAVDGLARSTALSHREQGIRCDVVAPGPVATAIEALGRSALAGHVVGPVGQATTPPIARPEEPAAAIAWPAPGEASTVHGVIPACDGGPRQGPGGDPGGGRVDVQVRGGGAPGDQMS
ncbi:short chain dehydrogenase [Geodermatophilus saharensis]|uniref:Short chain dehydrogenase n=1 Tax=Geodermatophilus saharensis TaxID=1137994 RepID=A0A239BL33_9ACTN|nr:SDR family NAD(P)-dependent oxidoreductase [Geodermatophilus saharensis]SNS08289.1 short chain dehydrogenase [Geodermatophilus saharensis]